MATHSSVLAWRIPGTEEPTGLPSMGSHRVRHALAAAAATTATAAAAYIYQCCSLNLPPPFPHVQVHFLYLHLYFCLKKFLIYVQLLFIRHIPYASHSSKALAFIELTNNRKHVFSKFPLTSLFIRLWN